MASMAQTVLLSPHSEILNDGNTANVNTNCRAAWQGVTWRGMECGVKLVQQTESLTMHAIPLPLNPAMHI